MPAFFIVGSARSGTTLVRLLLNAHPEIVVPPESRFVVELWRGTGEVRVDDFLEALARHPQFAAWELSVDAVARELPAARAVAYADAIDAVYRAYARPRGKTCWGDKTPRYIERLPWLAERFPAARFVHVVRDGRNVALSYADVPFGPKTVAGAARLWARRVRAGLDAGRALGPERYLELRYERLVAGDAGLEEHARRLCSFLGVAFAPIMLRYGEVAAGEALPKSAQLNPLVTAGPVVETRSWERQMPALHVEVFESLAGDVLSELGYVRRYPHPRKRARAIALLGRRLPVGRLKRVERSDT
jgi:hypothetical protein